MTLHISIVLINQLGINLLQHLIMRTRDTLQFGVTGYHLYLLHYASNSYNSSDDRRLINDFLTARITALAAQGCHVTFTDRNVKVIEKRSRDAHDVNVIAMNAYLDDGVDFFLLLFPRERESTSRDLQQLRSRLLNLWYFFRSAEFAL